MNANDKRLIGEAALRGRFGRPDDMPMVGKVTRESKKRQHRYVLTLKFTKSKRHYVDEIIFAVTKKDALKAAKRMFPNAAIK